MNAEHIECRVMTCDTLNSLLNHATIFDFHGYCGDANRATEIALRMRRQYFEQFQVDADYGKLRCLFEVAYRYMSKTFDFRAREVLTWRCEHDFSNNPIIFYRGWPSK